MNVRISFGYGLDQQSVELDSDRVLNVLTANEISIGLTGAQEVERALREPIGSSPLSEILHPNERICVITSDITRPMPSHVVLPVLLQELRSIDIAYEDVSVVFALGSHRKHSLEEQKRLVGEEVYNLVRCVDGDTTDCIHLGKTSRGTPVDIVREVATADKRICLGNIEYHYFAGYSGGSKAIMPGVSTRAAIQANHRMMVLPEAQAGNISDNPLTADIEEGAGMCGIDFLVNVVLNEHKEIVGAFAGDRIQAHRAGCRYLDKLYAKPISQLADIVLVSQGGAPKDLNLYQTQKALDNAQHAVKQGGTIILIGACQEGYGEDVFEAWIRGADSADSIITRIEKDFQLGGHKAAAIAMVQKKADIYMVSEMVEDDVRAAFMTPFKSAQEALKAATKKHGDNSSIIAMPYGGSTLPRVTI